MAERGSTSRLSNVFRVLPVAGAMCLIVAFGWAIWRRYLEPGALALGGLGVVFFLTTFARAEIANLAHYLNSSLYTIFVIGACVVLYIGLGRRDVRFDLTPEARHTLSETTIQYLELLGKDVEAVVFDTERRPYQQLLARYAEITSRFTWTLHDPDADPEFTRRFAPSVIAGTIFVRHDSETKKMAEGELSEAALTNAIVEVTREDQVVVYFLAGHGELSVHPSGNVNAEASEAASFFANFLAERAMKVASLDMVVSGVIPSDASLLVIARPTRDLYPIEVRQIADFLSGGGKLLMFFDLPTQTDENVDFSNIQNLLRRYGLEARNDVIVDLEGERQFGNPLNVPMSSVNESHPVSRQLARSTARLELPLVRSIVRSENPPENFIAQPLIFSSGDAWPYSFERLLVDRGKNVTPPAQLAPQPLGWAVEPSGRDATGPRLIVYGTSRFIQNRFIATRQPAVALMLNSVNWLTEREDLVAVPPREIQGTPLILTNAELQLILILIGLALPAALFFGGVSYVNLIRRR